jgi:hypothetical protein
MRIGGAMLRRLLLSLQSRALVLSNAAAHAAANQFQLVR